MRIRATLYSPPPKIQAWHLEIERRYHCQLRLGRPSGVSTLAREQPPNICPRQGCRENVNSDINRLFWLKGVTPGAAEMVVPAESRSGNGAARAVCRLRARRGRRPRAAWRWSKKGVLRKLAHGLANRDTAAPVSEKSCGRNPSIDCRTKLIRGRPPP
jgi:hypothetical protein